METWILVAIVAGITAILVFTILLWFLLTRKPKNKRALTNIVRESWGLPPR